MSNNTKRPRRITLEQVEQWTQGHYPHEVVGFTDKTRMCPVACAARSILQLDPWEDLVQVNGDQIRINGDAIDTDFPVGALYDMVDISKPTYGEPVTSAEFLQLLEQYKQTCVAQEQEAE